MDFTHRIKKAFRLDTYTAGAAVRNLQRIRWTLKNTPWRIRTVLSVYLNRELRNQLRADKQKLKIDHLLAQIDMQELDRIVQTYASREQSIWTKYLDARKWLTRNAKQVRKLGLVLNPPRDVLDLGCGAGYFLFVLKQLGSRVLGVDLDHDPIFNDMNRLFAVEPSLSASLVALGCPSLVVANSTSSLPGWFASTITTTRKPSGAPKIGTFCLMTCRRD
jgi:SAM-dependent methyltransferase